MLHTHPVSLVMTSSQLKLELSSSCPGWCGSILGLPAQSLEPVLICQAFQMGFSASAKSKLLQPDCY